MTILLRFSLVLLHCIHFLTTFPKSVFLSGGLSVSIYIFPDLPRRPGGLPVCDYGRAGPAGGEKAARPAALPAAGHPAGCGFVCVLSRLLCGPLLCVLLCHPADVHPVDSVGVADRVLVCLCRRVHGGHVPGGRVRPGPDTASGQRDPVHGVDRRLWRCGAGLRRAAAPAPLRALVPSSAGGQLRPAPHVPVLLWPGGGYGGILSFTGRDPAGISGSLLRACAGDGGAGGGAGHLPVPAAGRRPENGGPAGCHRPAAALRAGSGGHPPGGALLPARL